MDRGSPQDCSMEGQESPGSGSPPVSSYMTSYEHQRGEASKQRGFFCKSPVSSSETSSIALLQRKLQKLERKKETREANERQSKRSSRYGNSPKATWGPDKAREEASTSHQSDSRIGHGNDEDENLILSLSLPYAAADDRSPYLTDPPSYHTDGGYRGGDESDEDVDTSLHL